MTALKAAQTRLASLAPHLLLSLVLALHTVLRVGHSTVFNRQAVQ